MFPLRDKLGEIISVPNIWHNEAKQSEVLGIPQRKQHCYSTGKIHFFFLQYKLIPWRRMKQAAWWEMVKSQLCVWSQ